MTGGDDIASGGDVAAAASGRRCSPTCPRPGPRRARSRQHDGAGGVRARALVQPDHRRLHRHHRRRLHAAQHRHPTFTTPGNNGTGTNDWVLVLDTPRCWSDAGRIVHREAVTGAAPLTVKFTDNSTGTITVMPGASATARRARCPTRATCINSRRVHRKPHGHRSWRQQHTDVDQSGEGREEVDRQLSGALVERSPEFRGGLGHQLGAPG